MRRLRDRRGAQTQPSDGDDMGSVIKKRRKKMRKHKYKKLRARNRHKRKR